MWLTYRFPSDNRRGKPKLVFVSHCVRFFIGLFKAVLKKRPIVQIFYATETGTSKYYAENLLRMFNRSYNAIIVDMSQ